MAKKSGINIFQYKYLYLLIAAVLIGGVLILCAKIIVESRHTRVVMIGNQKYVLDVADTPVALEKGLGGRSSMPSNKGMLFILASSSDNCFWMKDMKFPLDMVWLDNNGKVIHTAADVKPDSYPNQYCSEGQPKYVVELNAGNIKCGNIRDGQAILF